MLWQGVLSGQAIGHDSGATLIGAAVGGALGYMVGNKMEKTAETNLIALMNRAHLNSVRPGQSG